MAQDADNFPLQAGNQWIYRSSQPFPGTWMIEVTGQRTVAGLEYFEVRGLSGVTLPRKNDAGTLVFYDLREQREKNWVAFGAPVGEAFPAGVDPCNRIAVIRSHAFKLRGPLGEFENGLEAGDPISGCADAGLTREVFLPDAGLVERRQSNIAGQQGVSRIYARRGGSLGSYNCKAMTGKNPWGQPWRCRMRPAPDRRTAAPGGA